MDRDESCVFCNIEKPLFLGENELCYAIYDINPIAANHTLIIPKRHVSDFLELYQPEINAVYAILRERKQAIGADNDVTGFNIMVSLGEDAGQEVPHAHVHLVPTTNPRSITFNTNNIDN
jgi:diadenosine tetraphosphate (Ap4A) HIT family hydrolase